MIDSVFISDLHLHPENLIINTRFNNFIQWAAVNTKKVYILGDLFHAWAGDDLIEPWVEQIAAQFSWLRAQGVKIFYMWGNRDFLIGEKFLKLAALELIKDPISINFGDDIVLLSHGDKYCSNDKKHQLLRRITRNKLFTQSFLLLPRKLRKKIVQGVRNISIKSKKSTNKFEIVPVTFIKDLKKYNANTLIHGHTHSAGSHNHLGERKIYQRYVLSDWDDEPTLMCYDIANGFYFEQFRGFNHAN